MISYALSRRLLQITIAIGALVPILAGGWGMLNGQSMLGPPVNSLGLGNIALDSHLRYLSGLLFAMGIAFWNFIPKIEKRSKEVRLLTLIIFIGGLARLYGALYIAIPPVPMQLAIVMELVVTPMLCWWQMKIARQFIAAEPINQYVH